MNIEKCDHWKLKKWGQSGPERLPGCLLAVYGKSCGRLNRRKKEDLIIQIFFLLFGGFMVKTGRHAFFWSVDFFITVVFGLVMKDFFIIWISDTHDSLPHPDHCGISLKPKPAFSLFLCNYTPLRIVTATLPPLAWIEQNLCECLDMFIWLFAVVCLHRFVWPFWFGCHSYINHQA